MTQKEVENYFKEWLEKSIVLPIDWVKRRKLAEKTSGIDYDCRFDKNGLCKGYRISVSSKMCCCGKCVEYFGYLGKHEPMDPESYEFLTSNFDLKTGFWREGTGCVIPRKWRSQTCLNHNCLDRRKDNITIQYLRELLKYPTRPIPIINALKLKNRQYLQWKFTSKNGRKVYIPLVEFWEKDKLKNQKMWPAMDENGNLKKINIEKYMVI